MSVQRTAAKASGACWPRRQSAPHDRPGARASCWTPCPRCAKRRPCTVCWVLSESNRTCLSRRRERSASSSGFPDPFDQLGGGALVLEGDRHHLTAAGEHTARARDALDGPITALH